MLIDDASYHQRKSVYLTREGLKKLAERSKLEAAAEFTKWLDDALPHDKEVATEDNHHGAIWVFEGRRVDIIVDKNGKEWFRGKDVCRILGFKNINDAVLKGVRESYKTDLKSLMKMTCVDHANPTPYHEGKTVYICSAEPPGDLNLVCTS